MTKRAYILLVFFLPIVLEASTELPYDLGGVTLSEEESPYLLTHDVLVPVGTVLNINPGVVVKASNFEISIEGDVNMAGTELSPIVFTSIKDDSVLGDTNGDLGNSLPQAVDWKGLRFSGTTDLQNVHIKYATKGIHILGGASTLNQINIQNGVTGVLVEGGALNLYSSVISNNQDAGVLVSSASEITITGSSFNTNKYPISIETNTPFLHSGNTASGNETNGILIGPLNSGEVVLKPDLIPYVGSDIFIASSSSLVLDPGVILKIKNFGITVDGELVLNGTKNNPVIITSTKDGSSVSPMPGDWGSVVINHGGKLVSNYGQIKYGGQGSSGIYPNIKNLGGELLLNNGLVSNAFSQGVYQQIGSSTIYKSSIENNSIGIRVDGGQMRISKSAFENNLNAGLDVQNYLSVTSTMDARTNWWNSTDGPRHIPEQTSGNGEWVLGDSVDFSGWLTDNPYGWSIDPVVVIPGILGSWKDWRGVWRLDPITHTYDNLVNTLMLNGYVEDENLFLFPYDWEKSNADTAVLLKQKIADIKAICSCSKVDIVAHSMGGLIARQYIQGNDYQNDVDQIIFLGTPHLGSVFAYLAYEGGEFGDGLDNFIKEKLLGFIGTKRGFDGLFGYAHNGVISLQELLPVTNYLKNQNGDLLNYPDGYPRNVFLENLDSSINLVVSRVRKIVNFVGDIGANSTEITLTVASSTDSNKWFDGEPIEIGYGNGDNRVSTTSALRIGGITDIHNYEHSDMVTGVEKEVVETLLLDEVSNTVNKSKSKNVLLLLVNSPVDVTVTSPGGNTYGANGSSNDNIFYTNEGDEEFLILTDPEEGNYQVTTTGTGQGEYSIDVHLVSDGGDQVSSIFGTTDIGQTNTETISVTNSFVEFLGPASNQEARSQQLVVISNIQSTTYTETSATTTSTTTALRKQAPKAKQALVHKKLIISDNQPPKQIQVNNTASVQSGWELVKNLLNFLLSR